MEKETKPASHGAGAWGAVLVLGIPRVELGQRALGDPLEHLLGEDPEELPADVQGLVHGAVLVGPCRDSHGGDVGRGTPQAALGRAREVLGSLP